MERMDEESEIEHDEGRGWMRRKTYFHQWCLYKGIRVMVSNGNGKNNMNEWTK